jgi:shikimate dehydrogenase
LESSNRKSKIKNQKSPHQLLRMSISGRTRIFGIIGDPVAHSLSPAMHNAAFAALRLDAVYMPFHVRPSDLRAAVAGMRALGIAGLNVTVPHKERVMRYLDVVSPTARRAGAVNTIVARGGKLHGENTDVGGFVQSLADEQRSLRGARIVLIGSGGAARAVLVGMIQGRASAVTIVNRTVRRAKRLAAAFRARTTKVVAAPLDAALDQGLLGTADLVVNATSLGLHDGEFIPLAYEASPPHCLFYDLVYGRRTAFLEAAARSGRPTCGGGGMLLHQGAAALSLWTGRAAPLTSMRAALRSATSSGGIS